MTALKQNIYRAITAAWNCGLPLPGADQDSVQIVCLHGVHTAEMERVAPPPTSSVSATSFEANMRVLRRYRQVISLGEAVEMISGHRPWRPRCAVLTFDDSLKCTTEVAFEILGRLGLTATVFISTEAIDNRRAYWWLRVDHAFHCGRADSAEAPVAARESVILRRGDWASLRRVKAALRAADAKVRDAAVDAIERQLQVHLEDPVAQFPYAGIMTWDDARDAHRRGFDVGSHTVTHPNLSLLEAAAVRAEVCNSKRAIENQLDLSCRHFCYPYGAMNTDVMSEVARAGYAAAVTTVTPGRNSPGQHPYALRRYAIPAAPAKLGYVLSGFPEALAIAKGKWRRSRVAAAGSVTTSE